MMKHILLSLAILICTCPLEVVHAHAKISPERILYIDSLPGEARQKMPKGARSCFYGSFKLSAEGANFYLHLLNPNPKQTPTGYFGIYHLILHIFEAGTNQRLRFVKSVEVDYRMSLRRPRSSLRRFGAQLLWLDPKERSKPILKFDCFDPNGIYGAIGDHVFVIFPEGIQSKTYIQSLAFGRWRASSTSGQTTIFDTDDEGLLGLHTILHPAGEETGAKWTLHWDGEKFHPVDGPIKGKGIAPGLPYP